MKQRTLSHYSSIVAVLLAGDIQARLLSNGTNFSVEVKTEEGSRVYWGNDTDVWAWIEVTKEGETKEGKSTLGASAQPEMVAELIYNADWT